MFPQDAAAESVQAIRHEAVLTLNAPIKAMAAVVSPALLRQSDSDVTHASENTAAVKDRFRAPVLSDGFPARYEAMRRRSPVSKEVSR